MIDIDGFKKWLRDNTEYSERVIGDLCSRMKRADGILEWGDDEDYAYHLGKEDVFVELTVSVKSQIRRAAQLYSAFYAFSNEATDNGLEMFKVRG